MVGITLLTSKAALKEEYILVQLEELRKMSNVTIEGSPSKKL